VYCVFCPANDLAALWAYWGLKRRGLSSLEIVTPEVLVYNRRLEHRLQDGCTLARLTLQDGRVLDSAAIRGALNRIVSLPQEHFGSASQADQVYAVQEQHAIYLSLLYSLPGALINRPGPRSLVGDLRSPAEWVWQAGKAGIPTLPIRLGSSPSDGIFRALPDEHDAVHAIVLDGKIFGQLKNQKVSGAFTDSIGQLAALSGLRLLGLDFSLGSDGGLLFASATPIPDLRVGGEALLDALAEALG
jgi:hypothetical protein